MVDGEPCHCREDPCRLCETKNMGGIHKKEFGWRSGLGARKSCGLFPG